MLSEPKKMEDYDVIVVGAGPAGAAAAYDLASCHLSVLLVDKTVFPREKACAGGLTVKAARALRYSAEPAIRKACSQMVISNKFQKTARLQSDTPLVFMTNRAELDDYCLNQAIAAGAFFRVIHKLHAVTERGTGVELTTADGTFRSAFLIGADGANSLVRKWCAPFPGFRRGFAIEARIPVAPMSKPHDMAFDFGVVPSGYGWVFPKKDHLNVGVYTHDARARLKTGQLLRYAKEKTGFATLENMAAHHIGLGGWKYRPRSKRVFLAGDAAGLADPLLGEGLHNAIKSGQAAARAIIQHRLIGENPATGFHRHIAPIQADIRLGYLAARWFYRFPSLGHALLTLPAINNRLVSGYAEGLSLFHIVTRSLLFHSR